MTTETGLTRFGAAPRTAGLTAEAALATGKILAQSGFFPEAKDAARAAAKILLGQELGLPPMASMKNIYVLDSKGKTTFQLAAATQLALVRQSGRYDYKIVTRDVEKAAILFERFHVKLDGSREKLEEYLSVYTVEDAARAGADQTKGTYKAHPKNMLFWRAATAGVAAFCPDVLCGPFYAEGEIDGGLQSDEPVETEGRVVAVESKRERDLAQGVAPLLLESVVQAPRPAVARISSESVREAHKVLLAGVDVESDLLAVNFADAKDQRPESNAAAAPVETAQAQPSAATEGSATTSTEAGPDPEASLDRTAAALGIKAGEGPLSPDGPSTADEEALGSIIPITHARGLIRRIASLPLDGILAANDAKDFNNYLKELLPGSGAKAAWAAAGVEIKAGVKVTKAQALKVAGYIATK